jgi:hypothetical protein
MTLPPWLNQAAELEVAALRSKDTEPSLPLALAPVVAIVVPDGHDSRDHLYCETLCQRLLYNGAATRMILTDAPPPGRSSRLAPTAYWIGKSDTFPEPLLSRREIVWPGDVRQPRGEDPRSQVRARIAAGECLMHGAAKVGEAGATIAYRTIKVGNSMFRAPWSLALDTVEASGRVLYRRTEVKAAPLVTPLQIGTVAGLLTTITYAGWARGKREFAPLGPNGRDVLPALLGPAGRVPDRPG